MRVSRRSDETSAWFVVEDLDEVQRVAAREMGFEPLGDAMARWFSASTAHVETAYANFQRHIEAVLRQRAGQEPVRWEDALIALLDRVGEMPLAWYLVGSAALAVRGLDVMPGDIDLVVAARDVPAFALALRDVLVEPVTPIEGWVVDCFGRAFHGAVIDIAGGVNGQADLPLPSDFGPVAAARLETIAWRGYELRVPPLDLQLAVNERRGRERAVALIREALAGR